MTLAAPSPLYPSPDAYVDRDVNVNIDADVDAVVNVVADAVVDVVVDVNVDVDVDVDVDGNGPYRAVSGRNGPLTYMELKPDKNSSRHIACREL
jgi:hypothetical protein